MRLLTIGCPSAWHGATKLEQVWREDRPRWVSPGWWTLQVREELLPLLGLQPGPELVALLSGLGEGPCPGEHEREPVLEAAGYPCGCQVVIAAAWEAVCGWSGVLAASALAAAMGGERVMVRGDGQRPSVVDPAQEDLALALRLPMGSMTVRVREARDLMAQPEAVALAEEGVLPLRTVRSVCQDVSELAPRDAAEVVAQWAALVRKRDRAGSPMNGKGAARAATRLIQQTSSHRRRRQRARSQRRVEVWPGNDGTATLAAILREEDAVRVHRRLTAIARGLDDDRPIDARRADVLVDLLLGRMVSQSSGVEMNVTVPLEVLVGLQDGLAEIPGFGSVPAEVARELAADARWRAWVTDAAGQVQATSCTTYRPSASLARLVRARAPECLMPGCSRPAARCDLDHVVPWPQGRTSADNLRPLCRRHHVLKTHYEWVIDVDEDAWSTPVGADVAIEAA